MQPDCAAIADALRLFNPEGPFEIRWFDGFAHAHQFTNHQDAADYCWQINAVAIYCTFNPLATLAKANADNIRCRRWFYVDIDPRRPADIPATAEEVNGARAAAHDVITFLEFMGWPRPAVSFTGNGIGLYYPIDLPNDAASTALVKRLLYGLAGRFDSDAVKIDPVVSDPARITRVPGTWNRKGVETNDRPHRQCVLLAKPKGLVAFDSLQAVAEFLMPTPKPIVRSRTGPATRGLTPGNDYDVNGPPFAEILDGWVLVHGEADNGAWRRPGKTEGISATTRCRGSRGEPIFHVFSSNASPFAPGPYGKFRALAVLKFNGDVSAAAKKLYADGWGERIK